MGGLFTMRNRPFLANAVSTVMLQILFETSALNQEGVTCNEKEMSDNLPFCLPKDYRKDVGPFTTDPLNVTIVAVFGDIAGVNDVDNTVTFSINLYIKWVDSRLTLHLDAPSWTDKPHKCRSISYGVFYHNNSKPTKFTI